MTLIMSAELGGVMVAMTCDTRQALMIGGQFVPYSDAKTPKIGRITPYCIFGGGGENKTVRTIKERLIKRKGDTEYVSELVKPFEEAIQQVSPSAIVQITISGFNENGTTGVITYDSDSCEVHYTEQKIGEQDSRAIAPSYDELNAIISTVKFPKVKDLSEFPNATLSYLSGVQAANFEVNPKAVSEICHYCIIYRDPKSGKFTLYEGSLNIDEE